MSYGSINRSKKKSLTTYQKGILGLITVSSSLFIIVSLFTFNMHDQSFFYISTNPTLSNWCGLCGSYVSSLLLYIAGGAALLVPIIMMYSMWLWMSSSLKVEWDRVAALICLIPLTSAFFTLYKFDPFFRTAPGGFLGIIIIQSMRSMLDTVGTLLVIHTLICICCVLIFRLSFVVIAQYISLGCFYAYRFIMHRISLLPRFIYSCQQGLATLATYIYKVYASIRDMFEGKEITNASIFEFESMHHQPFEHVHSDHFWHTMNHQSPSSDKIIAAQQIVVSPTHNHQEAEQQQQIAQPKEYHLPDLTLFNSHDTKSDDKKVTEELKQRAAILEDKLERFGVLGKITAIKPGPVVTLFEYQPDVDTKISKIIALEDDLALALQALSIRIIAPIPGRSVVGFEVANPHRKSVYFASIIQSQEYKNFSGKLPLVLGQDTIGNNVIVDLIRMPHLLIAGSTGSGKSVALNAMLVSLLCNKDPDDLKLILIDPKRLEFASYADIAHLIFPIITDPRKAVPVLHWVVTTMEQRYEKMAKYGVRNIVDYKNNITPATDEDKMPYIVVVIDELADLMMTAGKDIEDLITRLSQMARAAGIHLIVATQRPSVDVITGLIKVNFPSRISFRVTSKIDSRTILDCGGADKLLGRGDMLFLDASAAGLQRVHGAYVTDKEILSLVHHIKSERPTEYLNLEIETMSEDEFLMDADDEIYKNIVSFLQTVDEVSISMLQRRFRIGYNRSARIIDALESQGKIMPADGGKLRKVIRS